MKMSAQEWLEGEISTGGHFEDALKYVDPEDLKGLYFGLGHTRWILESFFKVNNISFDDPWKDAEHSSDKSLKI